MVEDLHAGERQNPSSLLALKVQKSAGHYSEAALDEIELLKYVKVRSEIRITEMCNPNSANTEIRKPENGNPKSEIRIPDSGKRYY